jgi:hypothetical protein
MSTSPGPGHGVGKHRYTSVDSAGEQLRAQPSDYERVRSSAGHIVHLGAVLVDPPPAVVVGVGAEPRLVQVA